MKEKKIIGIRCEPGKYAKVVEIENTLEALQDLVGGYIECITQEDGSTIICNEEGKLQGLEPCREFKVNGKTVDIIYGSFLIVGTDGEEFAGLSNEQIGRNMLRYGRARKGGEDA